jgi:hypothetical protein
LNLSIKIHRRRFQFRPVHNHFDPISLWWTVEFAN